MRRLWDGITIDAFFIFKIFYYLIKIFYFKLRGKKLLVYNLHHDYFYDIFHPIYEELKNDSNIKVFFSYKHDRKSLKEYLDTKISSEDLIPSHVSPFIPFDKFICAEITGPDFPVFFLKTKTAQLYHGTGTYNLYDQKEILSKFDVHFAIGPQYHSFFEEINVHNKDMRIYNIGYPKLDDLVTNIKEIDRKQDGKPKSREVILYVPHWNPTSSINHFGEDLLKALAAVEGMTILIKPHHYLYIHGEEKKWEEGFQKISELYSNVIYVEHPNTQLLYKDADIMITDVGSTAALEFSLLQKPVIIFNDGRWFEANHEYNDTEHDLCDLALKYSGIAELIEHIEKIIANDKEMVFHLDEQRIKQKKLAERYLYNLGKATHHAVKAIKKELGL